MSEQKVKELLIVCSRKTKNYANFLRQLVGTNDDADDVVLGTRDGSIHAAVCTEKEFPTVSSALPGDTYVLFVGSMGVGEEEPPQLDVRFEKFGMKYGWTGKKAFLLVERSLADTGEYTQFMEMYKTHHDSAKRILDLWKNDAEANPGVKKTVALSSLAMVDMFFEPEDPRAVADRDGKEYSHRDRTDSSSILDRQYKALTLMFYLDGMKDFMEQ